jgi:hypothetical protein
MPWRLIKNTADQTGLLVIHDPKFKRNRLSVNDCAHGSPAPVRKAIVPQLLSHGCVHYPTLRK